MRVCVLLMLCVNLVLSGKKLFGRSQVRSVATKRMAPLDDYCQVFYRLLFLFFPRYSLSLHSSLSLSPLC